MSPSRAVLCGLLFGVILSVITNPAEANSRRLRRAKQQAKLYVLLMRIRAEDVAGAQSQYAAAQQALSSASARAANAATRLSAATGRVRIAADELRQAQSIEVDLQKDLADVEEDLLAEQPANSPFALTQAEVQTLREASKRRETQLLQASAYVAKKAALAVEPESPTAIARFRQETLERDETYVDLQSKLAAATETLARLKRELFAADDEWQDTHQALVDARKVTRAAGDGVNLVSPGRLAIGHELREAQSAATDARGVISRAEETLERYNAPTTPKSSGSRAGKKK